MPEEEKKEAAPAPKKKFSLSFLLVLLNTLGIVLVGGLFYYVKYLYKHPPIYESTERKRLLAKKEEKTTEKSLFYSFPEMTVNIRPVPSVPQQKNFQGKLHYLHFQLVLEFQEEEGQKKIEKIRPIFLDKLLTLLGKKSFHELNSAHGRYLLRTQVIELANALLQEEMIQNAYFSKFILQ